MNFCDQSCLWFWILTPIALLSLTSLNLFQILLIMVFFAVIFKLFKIRPQVSPEGFLPGCKDCYNPYQDYLKKLRPTTLIIARTDQQPLTAEQVSQLKQQELNSAQGPPPPPQIPLPVVVEIEVPKPMKIVVPTPVKVQPARHGLCQTLEQAGFNPRWTYDDVRNLWATPEGKATLRKLNESVMRATGLSRLTNQQITSCYPNYIREYSCQSNPKIDMVKLNETINKQQYQIQSLKKQLRNDTESTLSKPVITADRDETEIIKPIQGKVSPQCPLDQITSQIRLEVERFYGQAYTALSRQLKPDELSLLKDQYSNLAQIVKGKAIQEYQELINLYRNQNRGQWNRELIKRKTNSSRGHPVLGTDFYIPWTYFDQNEACFGQSGNY